MTGGECDIHGRILGRYWRTSAEGAVCVEAVFYAYQVQLFLVVIEKVAIGTALCSRYSGLALVSQLLHPRGH